MYTVCVCVCACQCVWERVSQHTESTGSRVAIPPIQHQTHHCLLVQSGGVVNMQLLNKHSMVNWLFVYSSVSHVRMCFWGMATHSFLTTSLELWWCDIVAPMHLHVPPLEKCDLYCYQHALSRCTLDTTHYVELFLEGYTGRLHGCMTIKILDYLSVVKHLGSCCVQVVCCVCCEFKHCVCSCVLVPVVCCSLVWYHFSCCCHTCCEMFVSQSLQSVNTLQSESLLKLLSTRVCIKDTVCTDHMYCGTYLSGCIAIESTAQLTNSCPFKLLVCLQWLGNLGATWNCLIITGNIVGLIIPMCVYSCWKLLPRELLSSFCLFTRAPVAEAGKHSQQNLSRGHWHQVVNILKQNHNVQQTEFNTAAVLQISHWQLKHIHLRVISQGERSETTRLQSSHTLAGYINSIPLILD